MGKNKACGCKKKETCGCKTVCGCKIKVSAKCNIYEGVDLPYLGVKNGDNLENVLIKLESIICRFDSLIDPVPPTVHDITGMVADPFDSTEPALDCRKYNAGDKLVLGNNKLCPSFVYTIMIDDKGCCCTIMTQKPDESTSQTSS